MKRPLSPRAVAAIVLLLSATAATGLILALGHAPDTGVRRRELVIYSPHPRETTDYIVREFRQRTGIRVTVIAAGTGELISRMKERGRQNEADVFWGGGVESLETVAEHFAPYESPEDAAIRAEYKAPHNLWKPFSVLPAVIIYNENLVPKDRIPSSWADLLDPWFRNRIIMADPEKSGSSFTILATLLLTMGNRGQNLFSGWDYVEKLAGQLGPGGVSASSSEVYRAVASGDFYAGITYENYVLSLMKTGSSIGYCYPEEGTSAVPDGIALMRNARNRAEAEQFIDFVLSKDVQSLLSARWQRRPVRTDTGVTDATIKDIMFIRYPVAEAAAERDAILARWASLYAPYRP